MIMWVRKTLNYNIGHENESRDILENMVLQLPGKSPTKLVLSTQKTLYFIMCYGYSFHLTSKSESIIFFSIFSPYLLNTIAKKWFFFCQLRCVYWFIVIFLSTELFILDTHLLQSLGALGMFISTAKGELE